MRHPRTGGRESRQGARVIRAKAENLCNIFAGIQKALVLGNTTTAQELCAAGQQQLRDVVICFE